MEDMFCKHIFTINANNPHDIELHELRDAILNIFKTTDSWGQLMPSRWLLFEDKLMTKKREGVRIMNLDELEQLNKSSSLPLTSSAELFLFLKVHHDIGTFIHVEDMGIVILDAQWLADSIGVIIRAKRFGGKQHRKEWDLLHEKSIVEKRFIDSIWRECEAEHFFEFKDQLIKLMEIFDLIVIPRQYNEYHQHVLPSYFVVPCMMHAAQVHYLQTYFTDASYINHPLMFKFEDNFLPPATYLRLLANCIRQYGYTENPNVTVFADAAIFRVYKQHHLCLEITKSSIIANVISLSENHSDVGVNQGVREFLDNTLKCITTAQRTTMKYEVVAAYDKDGKPRSSWLKWKDLINVSTKECEGHGSYSSIGEIGQILQQWIVSRVCVNKSKLYLYKFIYIVILFGLQCIVCSLYPAFRAKRERYNGVVRPFVHTTISE